MVYTNSSLPQLTQTHQRIFVSMLIFGLCVLGSRTIMRNADWRDSRVLAFHDLQIQKDNYQLLSSVGAMYLAEENYEKAILPALEKNYRATMLAYEENREQLPAVIDAWEASNMAQLEYLDKQQEYYNMIVSYEKEIEK